MRVLTLPKAFKHKLLRSHKGTMGANVKQLKTLDKKIALDLIDQGDPLIKAALDMFPNAREYVEKNPGLLLELLPRLEALQKVPGGFKVQELFGPPSSLDKPTTHPFGMNEE